MIAAKCRAEKKTNSQSFFISSPQFDWSECPNPFRIVRQLTYNSSFIIPKTISNLCLGSCKMFVVAPCGEKVVQFRPPILKEMEKRKNVKRHVTSVKGVFMNFIIHTT